MEKRTLALSPIHYRRRVCDEGLVLGSRPWKWTLGNKYSPCIARRVDNNLQVSTLSPHKQNFQVYISRHTLEIGDVYKIVNQDYGKPRVETVLKIETIGANFVECNVLEEKTVEPPRKARPEITMGDQALFTECPLSPDGQNCLVVMPDDLTQAESENLKELLEFFGSVNEEQQTGPGTLPAKVSPEAIEEIEKDSFSFPSPRIMQYDLFVNGKNQNGFSFLMVNEGKEQLSMFAAPVITKTEPLPAPPAPPMVKKTTIQPTVKPAQVAGFSPQEIAILDAIGKGAAHIDAIIQQSGFPAGIVAGSLLMLEMSGEVTQKPGRYFAHT